LSLSPHLRENRRKLKNAVITVELVVLLEVREKRIPPDTLACAEAEIERLPLRPHVDHHGLVVKTSAIPIDLKAEGQRDWDAGFSVKLCARSHGGHPTVNRALSKLAQTSKELKDTPEAHI
jgi:hypothetical protein